MVSLEHASLAPLPHSERRRRQSCSQYVSLEHASLEPLPHTEEKTVLLMNWKELDELETRAERGSQ